MIQNAVTDYSGNIVGYRCSTCDEVKSRMWGSTCNLCRARFEKEETVCSKCKAKIEDD